MPAWFKIALAVIGITAVGGFLFAMAVAADALRAL
jgi:hypothetical protein